jgi:hypothetical protein
MNIENITSLAAILSRTGLENLSYRLLQHICCKPARFVLSETVQRSADRLTCRLYFERKGNDYFFTHYEASLIREQAMPVLTINQVALKELEQRMIDIDWALSEPSTIFRLNDESTWLREKRIEQVMNDLARLSAVEEGRPYADMFKVRFWSGTLLEELTGSLSAIRTKLEVSQRFYVLDQACITIEEALRFLQNRLVEKKLQARPKPSGTEDSTGDNSGSLLKKKRKFKSRKIV